MIKKVDLYIFEKGGHYRGVEGGLFFIKSITLDTNYIYRSDKNVEQFYKGKWKFISTLRRVSWYKSVWEDDWEFIKEGAIEVTYYTSWDTIGNYYITKDPIIGDPS